MIPSWLKALLAALEAFINRLLSRGVPADVQISVKQRKTNMAKVSFQLAPKSDRKKAVANPVTVTGSVNIALIVVDDTGAPVPGITAASVTTTITSDNPAFAITKVDELNYTGSIPVGTTGVANLSATCALNAGSPGPFTASIQCTLNIPPAPPVPADVTISVTPS